jgi:hypothetical protein
MTDGSSGVRRRSHETLYIQGYDLQHIKIDENEDSAHEGRDDWEGERLITAGISSRSQTI